MPEVMNLTLIPGVLSNPIPSIHKEPQLSINV